MVLQLGIDDNNAVICYMYMYVCMNNNIGSGYRQWLEAVVMELTCTYRSGWGVCPDITMFRGSGDGVN